MRRSKRCGRSTRPCDAVEGGVEIEADDVSVYAIGDCLRPFGVTIDSTYKKQVTLDDVFLDLTGKELRQ